MAIGDDNKATLTPLGADGTSLTGDPIPVQFNPDKYSTEWNMTWSEVANGMQWTRTTAGNLVLTLHYDSYEKGADVRDRTGAIKSKFDPGAARGSNTVGCLFQWGKMTYAGLVTSIKEDFTLFLADGTPVRSMLTLTLRPWPEE
jgi:hypothetical protein